MIICDGCKAVVPTAQAAPVFSEHYCPTCLERLGKVWMAEKKIILSEAKKKKEGEVKKGETKAGT